MQVRKTEFHKFANGEMVFVIPVYQRNYDWNRENCKQLFCDIINDMELRKKSPDEDLEGHFIGTVCFKVEGKYKHVIVDGQQRLTTLMILLKALYDNTDNEQLKKRIKNKFLVNEYANKDEVRIKLKPIKRDEGCYNKLILSETFNMSDWDESEKKSNIYKNYIYMTELIAQSLLKEDFSIFEESLELLEIVELQLDHENPQVIFESLNSTGLDLTNTDLLRNFLLMPLDSKTQERMYIEYWAKIEEKVGVENIEQFMIHYLCLKRESDQFGYAGRKHRITNKTLYTAFKIYLSNCNNKNVQQIEELFGDLLTYAQMYSLFYQQISNKNPAQQKLNEIFHILEVKSAAIICMVLTQHLLYQIIDMKTYEKVLDILISYALRSAVCKKQSISNQFTASVIRFVNQNMKTNDKLKEELKENKYVEYVSIWWQAFNIGKGEYSFPKDDEFYNALLREDIYNSMKSKKCKYILAKLEEQKNPKEIVDFKDTTIEHVMPRTLSPEWK